MKKNFTLTLIIAAAVIGFSMNANAQQSEAFVATNATVIQPISVAGGSALNFGDIVGASTGGDITVDLAGVRTSTNPALVMGESQEGTISAATFTVTGQTGYAYSLAYPGVYTIANGDTTPATMSVGGFTSNETGTLTTGTELVTVGATLTVSADQATGVYTSAEGLTVTVQYN